MKRILVGLVLLVLGLAVVGGAYQAIATARDEQFYPAPGLRVDVGGYNLHLYCQGAGAPTVILDAQNGGTVSNWVRIQSDLAQVTRGCAYDREGLGWSDLSPQANDTVQNARALHTLLERANIAPPYVLVGHSLGGLYVRVFADQFPNEVAGMVLIEATHPNVLRAQGKPDVMPGADATMMNLGPWVSRLGLLRAVHFISADPDLPERQRAELDAYYASTKFAETIKRQFELFPTLLAQVRALGGLGDLPLAVVVGSSGDGGNEVLQPLFAEQAALSTNSFMVTVDGATHLGLVDNQKAAAETSRAIRMVLDKARGAK